MNGKNTSINGNSMDSKCKFAFCTNVSLSSLERLDLALFDIWSFNLGIDLIHLKEEDDSEQKKWQHWKRGSRMKKVSMENLIFLFSTKAKKIIYTTS
ncbi:MAG: hypothetical protein ACI9DJ_000809 [Algoriphagus sp.]|jgi:hypothetical protein